MIRILGNLSRGEKVLLKPNSLLLYKQRPARLIRITDRLEIEIEGGEMVRVREKDVVILHPGPLNSFADLKPVDGDVHTAWEILAGERTNLSELTELIYGKNSPAGTWAAWQQVLDGSYFEGTPEDIRALTSDEVARRKLDRDTADASKRAWQAFMARVRQGQLLPADRDFLRDVENLALGRGTRSQVLRELGRAESRENAHALLLELNVWDVTINPYPARQGIALKQVDLPVPELPEEARLDLTHLPAFAIDDEGTDTPDDAISLEGSRLWVHVADASAVVTPDSALDVEARARGMSLHLPEETIHLLPRDVTLRCGLGLQEESPAVSFGIDFSDEGQVTGFEIVLSKVRVTRLTYPAADLLMDSEPFCTLERLANSARAWRKANGAVMLDFPEARIKVEQGQVQIHPLPPLRSRLLVEEAMILTGIQTANFAAQHGIALPYSQQEAPDDFPAEFGQQDETLSAMFAVRRRLNRSRYRASPAPHSGLGAPSYSQVTSPLRRYLDLVAHQQIRAFLQGQDLLDETALLERIGSTEAVLPNLRHAEVLSEKHWTMVYLLQNAGWKGAGILVEKRGATGIFIIPSLALETRIHLKSDPPLDSSVPLKLAGVTLPMLDANFRLDR
jgi:exoribonuclease II